MCTYKTRAKLRIPQLPVSCGCNPCHCSWTCVPKIRFTSFFLFIFVTQPHMVMFRYNVRSVKSRFNYALEAVFCALLRIFVIAVLAIYFLATQCCAVQCSAINYSAQLSWCHDEECMVFAGPLICASSHPTDILSNPENSQPCLPFRKQLMKSLQRAHVLPIQHFWNHQN